MSENKKHTPTQENQTLQTSGTSSNQAPEATSQVGKKQKKHLIKPTWLRRTLKTLLCLVIFILLIPVLIYIPFVQDALTDVACRVASSSTGMTVKVDRFRLKFPLDVQLDGVLVLTEKGDTMVQAKNLVADVKMLPLLKLDAQINKVSLHDGKYMMVSEDSSMTMRLRAGLVEFVQGSNLNLKNSHIALKRPVIKNADISLYMDVWKQKPDSVSTPVEWVIAADKLQLENVRFRMSMLPTIKDLDVTIGKGSLTDALIDLKNYDIHASNLIIDHGRAKYITPTEKYIQSHPAPVDTVSPPSTPYTIKINNAKLNFDYAFYGVDEAKPLPGFDPSYIEATDVAIALENFYNQATTVKLPIKSMKAKERSGLAITSGSGDIDIDSLGINLSNLDITTPNSSLKGDANISYALMALNPDAPVILNTSGSLGWADLYAYMPSLKATLSKLPNRDPIVFKAGIDGNVSALDITDLSVSIRRFLALKASGRVYNPLDMKKLRASVDIDGSLQDAGVVNRWFGPQLASMGVKLPSFSIKGHVGVTPDKYDARLAMKSSAGDASVNGSLAMTAEKYDADLKLNNFDVSAIMPSLGVGTVTGALTAHGAGFNPMARKASTDIEADLANLVYGGHNLAPLSLYATLANGDYDIDFDGTNPNLNLSLSAVGNLTGNSLTTDMQADIRHVDLQKLGFMVSECAGAATFDIKGTADISTYFCNLDASLYNLDWNFAGSNYSIPEAFDATFVSQADKTQLNMYGDGFTLNMDAAAPLKGLIADIPKTIDMIMKQVDSRSLNMEAVSDALPSFTLDMDLQGSGLVDYFLGETGYKFSSLNLSLQNDSVFGGNMKLLEAGNASLTLDTITLDLNQRGQMLDYKAHMGNTKTNMPAFADVNISGYMGANRLSAFLRQHDSEGKEGYRLGLTAALMDSTVNLHLTPLNATIAYKPWEINDDNYIQIGPGARVQADLTASSHGSSIRLNTPQRPDSLQSLQVQIANLHIEDFLQMDITAPPITGNVNSDLTLVYRGKAITGNGSLGIKDLAYDRQRIGDFDFDVKAGMGFSGNSGGKIGMLFNGKEVMVLRGYMITDSVSKAKRIDGTPTAFELEMKEFPLSMANPFLPADYMQLIGHLNGKLKMTGEFTSPILNGSLSCDSAAIRVPMAGTTIRLDSDNPVVVANNVLSFNKFNIYGANDNPLQLNGSIDASTISKIAIDLGLNGKNVAVINNKRSSDEIYGKLFIDLDASVKGPLSRLDIDAALSILPSTDIFYTMATAATAIQNGNTTDVVKFVQFSDSTLVAKADSIITPAMNMDIDASLNIINGAKATVNLSTNGTDKVTLTPYGTLSYTQNYMGDMRLNGSLYLGTGFARYSIPMIGEKTFTFNEGSYVNWSGEMMNPSLHIAATDRVKANVQQEGVNSRLIYFDVGLSVSGNLSAPKVAFDLSTDDDMTVQNELLSMSPDQRSASAMHLLLTNTYTGPGVKANANLSNPLYSFLEGQLNSWAAKTIKGVDLSFGIDNYKQTIDGEKNTTTSYSYQVSKSLFDNRFKIIVGGNYSTDAQADENFAQNLISDISFEYSLKQSANLNMYLRLFRHTGFESILEGEVTETGVGFVMRKKLSNLRSLFRFGKRRHKSEDKDSLPSDSLLFTLPKDSSINVDAPEEK